MRIKRLILLVAIIFVVILIYKYPFKTPADEITAPDSDIDLADDNLTAFGDLLKINFVLKIKEDNTVVDTNDPVIADKFNITNYVKGPYSLILGNSDKLKLKSFDRALIGWKVGEKKTVEISPTEEEMFIKFNRTKSQNLYFAIPRYQRLSLKSFKELFGKEAVIGDTVSNPAFPWDFKIANLTENSAVGDPVVKINKKYKLPKESWPVEVLSIQDQVIQLKHAPDKDVFETAFGLANVSISGSRIIIKSNPVEGTVLDYDISLGPVSIPAKFEVVSVTESDFVIQRIDNLNDKLLVLDAEILERIPDVKFVRNESIIKVTEKVR